MTSVVPHAVIDTAGLGWAQRGHGGQKEGTNPT